MYQVVSDLDGINRAIDDIDKRLQMIDPRFRVLTSKLTRIRLELVAKRDAIGAVDYQPGQAGDLDDDI